MLPDHHFPGAFFTRVVGKVSRSPGCFFLSCEANSFRKVCNTCLGGWSWDFLPHPWSLSSHKSCLQNWPAIGHCLPGLLSATLEWLRLHKSRWGKWLTGWLSSHGKLIFWRVSNLLRWLRCFLCDPYPPPPSASLLVSISPSSALRPPLSPPGPHYSSSYRRKSAVLPRCRTSDLGWCSDLKRRASPLLARPQSLLILAFLFKVSHKQRMASLIGIKIIFSPPRGCMAIFKQLHLTKME